LTVGCVEDNDFPAPVQKAKGASPYEKISSQGADPAQNGPDDSTVLSAIPGPMGDVKFTHFTHASSSAKAFGIPCRRCHHKTEPDQDPSEGCISCHKAPGEAADPALMGPDDMLVLTGGRNKAAPVPFNHFTHASGAGYKIGCDKCHHTGGDTACRDCHLSLATMDERGDTIPREKRAFHVQCKGCHKALKQNQPDTKAPTTCKECHRDREFETPEKDLALNRALHIQCIGCHIKLKEAGVGENAPSQKCGGCHARPEPEREPTFAELAGELLEKDTGKAVEEEIVRDPELEKNIGPDQMIIDHAKQAKAGTPFPHRKHQGLGETCYTCHHKGLKEPTCRSCHGETEDAKKIYHKNCITCHKENGVSTACNDCHPK
jgi:hypothetical protein